MATRWETLWTFRTPSFTVRWAVAPDDDADLSFDETGETAAKVESGEWTVFQSRITVEFEGIEVASDYLGGSIYANPRDFRDHFGMNGPGHGSYFSDMVRNACRDARKQVAKMQSVRLRAA